MKVVDAALRLSATDLANSLGCRHLTRLSREVAEKKRPPSGYVDPTSETLKERGLRHEAAYLEKLRADGKVIAELLPGQKAHSRERVIALMREGYDVIPQATMTSGTWLGYADFLVKVKHPRDDREESGNDITWSYEAYDTKLSRETKATAVLQLALYSDILEEMQGVRPRAMTVVAPGVDAGTFVLDSMLFADYRAYYRAVRKRFEEAVSSPDILATTKPEPVPKCDTCEWFRQCESDLRAVDHLSFVARLSRQQRDVLGEQGIETLTRLAREELPLTWKPSRGSKESIERACDQARVQLASRGAAVPKHELLPMAEGKGLLRLPKPSEGDIFFDFEGDPFVRGGGLEYLFGYAYRDAGERRFDHLWALDHVTEKAAFETFVDWLEERRRRYPDMHVYHFAPYEPAALKRLMLRHASRAEQIDDMLRKGVFIDLLAVVREGVRIGVESYSIKKLEPCFGYVRAVKLDELGEHKRRLEAELELAEGGKTDIHPQWMDVVRDYNRDDCFATWELRDWLEGLRSEEERRANTSFARPQVVVKPPADEKREAAKKRARELRERLAAMADKTTGEESAALRLLANLVEFHIREEKVVWWELFRLRDLPAKEVEDEPHALAGLTPLPAEPDDNPLWRRYAYPPQVVDVRVGDDAYRVNAPEDEKDIGNVVAIDRDNCVLVLHRVKTRSDLPLTDAYFHEFISAAPMRDALLELATAVADGARAALQGQSAAIDLLQRRQPRLRGGPSELARREGENTLARATRLAKSLSCGVLPIQGPPGTGKTFTGAHMIAALADAGFSVGVTAVSHKVISNLMDRVATTAGKLRLKVRCLQKIKDFDEHREDVIETDDNDEAYAAIADKSFNVVGGTSWLWSSPNARVKKVDYLFIDEAGQFSLANALAVATAANNVVLLGDPRQLEQPQRGSHPDGAGVSALEHLLGDAVTVKDDAGLFLEETWRLHPDVTAFTTTFYEERLKSVAGLEKQGIHAAPLVLPGLYHLPVDHEGSRNESRAEVETIRQLYAKLTAHGATWRNANGEDAALGIADILVVAPYNAQVDRLRAALPDGARVGTVDKFQGQEAPVVIVSMTSSTIADAPRGAEFLLSANRLNVATSRAKCACVLVTSATLFDMECRTPRQMRLADGLFRYLERVVASESFVT